MKIRQKYVPSTSTYSVQVLHDSKSVHASDILAQMHAIDKAKSPQDIPIL
jgi:hypothetical protein